MSPRKYTKQELEQLLYEFDHSTPIFEIEAKISRSAKGLVQKMQFLSNQKPDIWNPEKVAEYRREQEKEYREQHKDEEREYRKQYYQQHRDNMREYQKRYQEKHRDKIREKNRRYQEKHRDKINEQKRQWYQQHKEEERERLKQYRKEHREYMKEYRRQRYYEKGGREYMKEYSRQRYEQNKGKWRKFGKYLAGILSEYDKTKKEFAQELNVNPSHLSAYLSGNRRPTEVFLINLSSRFGVSYQTLESLLK